MNSSNLTLGLAISTLLALLSTGCERRQYYRTQADEEVNCIIQQSSQDPRWALAGVNVMMDPRSRYFDNYNPDCSPMPQDDPESHKFMHCIDGKRGYEFWDIDGTRAQMENPDWRYRLGEYVPLTEDGSILLNRDSALRLAYVNSTAYQGQLETLYLSALDVSTERFRFDTQFFGNTASQFNHTGQLTAGGESNTLTQATGGSINRQFATAGTLLVTFANSFVWQFSGPDTNAATSILGISFIQPLLRNGGRGIALEQLTIVERALLGNLRAFERYRQGFYTNIVIGSSGVGGLQRRGGFFGGTGLSGFTGTGAGGIGGVGTGTFGFGGGGGGGVGGGAAGTGLAGGGAGNVGGFIGLLQTLQEFRNAQDSFDLQVRTLSVLEAYNDAGQIDLVQVDQFRQSIETQRAQLLQSEIALQNSIEGYLTGTLSLPPDIPVELDDEFIRPFQLVADEFTRLQNRFNEIQDALARFADPDPNNPETLLTDENLATILEEVQIRRDEVQIYLAEIQVELDNLYQVSERRKQLMTPEEQATFEEDVTRLTRDIEELLSKAESTTPELEAIIASNGTGMPETVLDNLLVWIRDFQFLMQEVALIQARIRVESIYLDPVQLDSSEALQIALANRFDVMNNRASIVDVWRLINFNANRLRSDVSVRLDGNLSTTGNNPLAFDGSTGTMSARLQFDAPFTRLLERNNYRQALIDYQSSRRQYIQFVDGINSSMRSTIRQLDQLRLNLEIQRRAVVIAIRRVDATQQDLEEPLPVPVPGQPAPQRGATVAQNLLSALEDLRNTQNNFMSVWLNYYATRMALMRDLGLMRLDQEGAWIDEDIDFSMYYGAPNDYELPPALPQEWLHEAFPEGIPDDLQILPEEVQLEQNVIHATQISYETIDSDQLPPLNANSNDEVSQTTAQPMSRRSEQRAATTGGQSRLRSRPVGTSSQSSRHGHGAAQTRIATMGQPNFEAPALEPASATVEPAVATEQPTPRVGLLDRLPLKRLFGGRDSSQEQTEQLR